MLGRHRKQRDESPFPEHARKLAEADAAEREAAEALQRAKRARMEARSLRWRLQRVDRENHFADAVRRALEGGDT